MIWTGLNDNIEVIDKSVRGLKSFQLFDDRHLIQPADMYVIWVGSNDLDHKNANPRSVVLNILRTKHYLENYGARVFVIMHLDRYRFRFIEHNQFATLLANKRMTQSASRGLRRRLDYGFVQLPLEFFHLNSYPDGIHLLNRLYRAVAVIVFRELRYDLGM